MDVKTLTVQKLTGTKFPNAKNANIMCQTEKDAYLIRKKCPCAGIESCCSQSARTHVGSPTLHIRDNFYDLYFHQRLGKCCLRLLLLLIFPSLCSLWLDVMRCGTRELNGIGSARKNTQSFCLLSCKLRSENRCKRFTKLTSFTDHPNENSFRARYYWNRTQIFQAWSACKNVRDLTG